MTLAKFGQGAALTRAGNAIAEITDVTLPNPKAAVLKVTNHASPSGWEEKIYGLIDGDKVQVTCNFRPDDTNGQMGLIADRGGRVIQTFVLTAPPAIGISLQFSGLVVQAQPIFPKDKEATFKAEIEVTGIVTYNTNASTNLTNLSATLTTLVPSFSGAVYEYDGIVTPGSTSVTVTPTNATPSPSW